MDRSRRRLEEAGLRRAGRRSLPRAQLQQPQQPRVLRPQPRQLRSHSRGNLSHAHTICNPRPCSSCPSFKRQPGHARRSFRRRPVVGLPEPASLGVVCEMTTSQNTRARRADRGTWRIPAAAFANVMSKAAREAEIECVSRPAAHRPVVYQQADQQLVRELFRTGRSACRSRLAWTPVSQALTGNFGDSIMK